ncbi:FAD-dependent oxidoreductase [Candidatus Protochlamydia phocaeensis]|uniref:FAD-dependent oxidoreductase n=1 Tax=Candidatus Protochlamydia phocaeensis TaxID=1414722 RepID=UPI00083914C7|nr:hypothetical protein [Candidatus Protochlamydia phocaeensis]
MNIQVNDHRYNNLEDLGQSIEKNLKSIANAKGNNKTFYIITNSEGKTEVKIPSNFFSRLYYSFFKSKADASFLNEISYYLQHSDEEQKVNFQRKYTHVLENYISVADKKIQKFAHSSITNISQILHPDKNIEEREFASKQVGKKTAQAILSQIFTEGKVSDNLLKQLEESVHALQANELHPTLELYEDALFINLMMQQLIVLEQQGSLKQKEQIQKIFERIQWPDETFCLTAKEEYAHRLSLSNFTQEVKAKEVEGRIAHLSELLKLIDKGTIGQKNLKRLILSELNSLNYSVLRVKEHLMSGPSITANENELITLQDLKAMHALSNFIDAHGKQITQLLYDERIPNDPMHAIMRGLQDSLNSHHLDNIVIELSSRYRRFEDKIDQFYQNNHLANYSTSDLLYLQNKAKSERLSTEDKQIIADCKAFMLELSLEEGTALSLRNFMRYNQPYGKHLETIRTLSLIQNRQLDDQTLALFKAHRAEVLDSASQTAGQPVKSPEVIIEGGGPTGLFTALKQYISGANVKVFEKRTENYSREQIVRLDPKWVMQLQYYLGTKFDELFISENKKGILRPDGFVEITINNLENALKQRLDELIAQDPGAVELHFQSELVGIDTPSDEDKPFQAVIKKQYGEEQKVAADMVICCGGKHSPIRTAYMAPSKQMTSQDYYGVAVWHFTPNANNQKPDFSRFGDFRGGFGGNELRNALAKREWLDALPEEGLDGNLFYEVARAIHQFPADLEKNITQKAFQIRTFENRGLIYLGMQIPPSLHALVDKIEELKREEVDPDQKNHLSQVQKKLQMKWFESVAEVYGLDKAGMVLQEKSVGTFPVAQQRVAQPISEVKSPYGQELLIAAAGDSFASPHFMRYSGLSGARQNTENLQSFTERLILANANPDPGVKERERQEIFKSFIENQQRTADFVIRRGLTFLQANPEEAIKEDLHKQMADQLEQEIKLLFSSEKQANYLFFQYNNTYHLSVVNAEGKEEVKDIIFSPNGQYIVDGQAFASVFALKTYLGMVLKSAIQA